MDAAVRAERLFAVDHDPIALPETFKHLHMAVEIRAPELTTEEFLLVATARPELSGDHRGLLTSFRERCDRAVPRCALRPDVLAVDGGTLCCVNPVLDPAEGVSVDR